jgi:phytoene dehydrogenase-like protein
VRKGSDGGIRKQPRSGIGLAKLGEEGFEELLDGADRAGRMTVGRMTAPGNRGSIDTKEEPVDAKYDVIVVGAGIGGAACAALLARRGVKTLLIDKNAIPGGKAMTASSRGFRYEFWPIVGGPSLDSQFAHILDELEMAGEVDLLAPKESNVLMYRRPGQGYVSHVASAAPEEGQNPLAIAELLGVGPDEIPEVARLFGAMLEMTSDEIDRLDDVTFAEFIGSYRLPRSVRSYLGTWANIVFVVPIDLLATSEAIRTFQDMSRGGAGRYHSGGFGRVAEVFCQAVEKYGGTVLLSTRVDRIRAEQGEVTGVVTESGVFEAPIVVSNAGIQPTVLRLVGEEHFDRGYVSRVRGLVPSWGIVGIRYFLDRPFFERGMYLAFSDESYLDSARLIGMKSGKLPEEVIVFNVVPAFYDSSLAPEGKQCALVGTPCFSSLELPIADATWEKLDESVRRLWPGIEQCIESAERYSTAQVSSLTRDAVVPGQGGECVGLAQIVGQCGRHKPSAQAPLRGLFYVGCDAGGYGCGTHQAADSGVKVADLVHREHQIRAAAF